MPTTFTVFYLGNFADIDTSEGDSVAENAAALVGVNVGGYGDSLLSRAQTLSPGNARRDFESDDNTYYDQDDDSPERFRIDGGSQQDFDSTAVYNATITYFDGTTATITAVVFQDTNGETYLAPEFADNADQAALEAGPLLSISLDSLFGSSYSGMTGDRQDTNLVPCFTPGARIATLTGLVAVEDLKLGDRVMTLDSGFQPIRWIGKTTRKAEGALTPIRIRAGALGQNLPERDMMVSPQHRMLLRSRIAHRMTGSSEVLVPAKKLIDLPGIDWARDQVQVTYIHFLCDRHEIVFAEGAPTETLLTGPQALRALGPDAVAEIATLFPELMVDTPAPARPIPKGQIIRGLLARHARNAKPLLQD